MKAEEHHVVELQSLRGIAALMVVGAHTMGYFATPEWFSRLHDLSNGQAAVILFFVLSGYVLVRSLRTAEFSAPAILRFLAKRFFRIYPALWVASLLGLLYLLLLHYDIPVPGTSLWFQQRFRPERMAPLYIIASFAGALAFILPPIWTIFVELVASLAMPAVAFLAFRCRWLFWGLLATAALVSVAVGQRTYYSVLLYAVDFVLGASICIWPSWLAERINRLGHARPWLFAAAACLLVGVPFASGSSSDPWLQLAAASGAVILIALIVHGKLQLGLLRSRPVAWLGNISYSVYLLHFPVMCVLVKAAVAIWPDPVARVGPITASLLLAVATAALTLPLSGLSYHWVERPGITLGRIALQRVTRKGERPRIIPRPI